MKRTDLTKAPVILIPPCVERPIPGSGRTSLTLHSNYPNAIIAGGGVPWIMPRTTCPGLVAEMVKRCHGVLLTGGEDVQTELYMDNPPRRLQKTVKRTDPERDLFEALVIGEAFRQRRPLLGICRGHQIINVVMGGTLLVDIATQRPDALNHARFDRRYDLIHDVTLTNGTALARISGTNNLRVNSSHHQAVDRIARPFRVTATSSDGIAESLELTEEDHAMLPFFLTVQYHPERLIDRCPEHLQLFKSFVHACLKARSPII